MDQNARGSTSSSGQSNDSTTTLDPQQRFQEISEAYSRLVSAIDQQKRSSKASSNDAAGESSVSTDAVKMGGGTVSVNALGSIGGSTKPSGKKKRQQRKHQANGNSAASSASASSTSSSPLSSSLPFPPLPFPPELAAHYLSSAAAAAAAASNGGSGSSGPGSNAVKGRVFGPILPPKMTVESVDGNKGGLAANFDFGAFARSCGGINLSELGVDSSSGDGSGDSSTFQTAYSEAEIKALMSMFVEFMGMFSEQDNPACGSGDGTSLPAAISRETIMKMNAALAASSSAAAAAKAATNSSDSSSKSQQADAAASFPVFSMLFGIPRPGFSPEALNVTPEAVAKAWKSELGMDGPSGRNSSNTPQSYSVVSNDGDWADYYEEDEDDDDDDEVDDDDDDIDDELPALHSGEDGDNGPNDVDDGTSGEWVYNPSANEVTTASSSQSHWIMTNPETKSESSSTTKTFSVSSTRKSNNNKRDNPPQDKARGLTLADQQFVGSKGSRSAVTGSFIGKPLPVIKCYHGRVCGSVSLQKMAADKDHEGSSNTNEHNRDCCSHTNDEDIEQDEELNAEMDPDDNNEMDKNEERTRKAAKKREKKNRRKEKAKREAALRAAITAQRRREVRITSWRSRVATACSNGEVGKLESLLSECPFKNMPKGGMTRHRVSESNENNKHNTENQGEGETSTEFDACNDYVIQHMEWLLQSCVPKSNFKATENERDARQKLALFIMSMCVEVIFQPFRNGRNALHVACQLGDAQFVRSVVEHVNAADNNNSSPTSLGNIKNSNICSVDNKNSLTLYLDWLCEESGWSPLHYATASGSVEVIEILSAGGSNVKILTNPSLTCKLSNGKGASPLELAESIHSGKWKSHLVCHGMALEEAVAEDVNSFEELISRLVDIEQNGYTPLNPIPPAIEDDLDAYVNDTAPATNIKCDARYGSFDEIDSNNKIILPQNLRTMDHEISKKKKRNRKKKSQPQQQQPQQQVPPAQPEVANLKDEKDSQEVNVLNKSQEEDPLVSALLAMGFTTERVEAAVKACGGTERATADDLVAWIFENESCPNSVDNSEQTNKAKPENVNIKTPEVDTMIAITKTKSAGTNAVAKDQHIQRNVANIKAQQMQRITAQAKREAIEAAEREKEAQAAAQRLAAKREEQRRINREWNNREQVRQREEAQTKVLEEIERRKKAEQDRINEEAMKMANDGAQQNVSLAESSSSTAIPTTSAASMPRVSTPHSSTYQPHSPLLMNTGESNVTSTHPSQFQVPNVQQYQSMVPYPSGESCISVDNTFNVISTESNSVRSLSVGSEPKGFGLEAGNATHSNHETPNTYHGLMVNAPEFNSSEFINHPSPVLHENTTGNIPLYVDEYGRQPEVAAKFIKDPQQRSARNSGQKQPKLEVNAYDFPELGKEKEQKPQKIRNTRTKNSNQTDESTVSSGGSGNKKPGRGKQRHNKVSKNMNNQSIVTNGVVTNSTPPPGFRTSGGYVAKQQSNLPPKNTSTENSNYVPAPNSTGEIRATARAFVPCNFTPVAPNTPVADKKFSGAVPPPGLDAPLFGTTGAHVPSASPANANGSPSFSAPSINAYTPSLATPSTANHNDPDATVHLIPVHLVPVAALLSSTPAPIVSKNDTAPTATNASMSTLLASVSSSLLPLSPSPGLSSTSSVTGGGVPGIDDASLYGSKLVNPSTMQEGGTAMSSIWGGGPSTGGFSTLSSFSFTDTNQQQQQPRPRISEDKTPAVGNFFLGGSGAGLGSIW